MNILLHSSAKPSHYNKGAEHYDTLNEENSKIINHFIEKVLRKHKVNKVLDLTCGTGSQVFWLAKRGYEVVGVDINSSMLKIAKNKVQLEGIDVSLLKGDMRTSRIGEFDAVLTIFNAVGHLTKDDFEKSMLNVNANLKKGGLYIFDIFNLDYLLHDNQITKLTIDWQKQAGNTTVREIQYSTIDQEGILASYTISYVQQGFNKPKLAKNNQTLQVYSSVQLRQMLANNGFSVLEQCSVDGSKLDETQTERILTIARKN